MGAIITLTTDFGLADAYVAAMKGAILSINPEANIIDICHTITSQSIPQAAFVLSTVYRYFPPKTIHVVVVDPGVGTERRAIVLRTPFADFVAPDNGVLSYVIQQSATELAKDKANPGYVKLGKGLKAVHITNPKFWRLPVSATFHGRDIFAPVAAHLSLGVPPAEFGEEIESLVMLLLPQPHRVADGSLIGHILHIDHFGNLITDVRRADLPGTGNLTIEVGGKVISGLSRTYTEREGLLALMGSSDRLEVAVRKGSARSLLGAEVGTEIIIRPPEG